MEYDHLSGPLQPWMDLLVCTPRAPQPNSDSPPPLAVQLPTEKYHEDLGCNAEDFFEIRKVAPTYRVSVTVIFSRGRPTLTINSTTRVIAVQRGRPHCGGCGALACSFVFRRFPLIYPVLNLPRLAQYIPSRHARLQPCPAASRLGRGQIAIMRKM